MEDHGGSPVRSHTLDIEEPDKEDLEATPFLDEGNQESDPSQVCVHSLGVHPSETSLGDRTVPVSMKSTSQASPLARPPLSGQQSDSFIMGKTLTILMGNNSEPNPVETLGLPSSEQSTEAPIPDTLYIPDCNVILLPKNKSK